MPPAEGGEMEINMKKKGKIWIAFVWMLISSGAIISIFVGMTFVWIFLKGYSCEQFKEVLCSCIKNAGAYSTLLVGITVTIIFQIYSREKEIEEEEKIKIKEVGYYTLAFQLKGDQYKETFSGEKLVVEIENENDFAYDPTEDKREYFHVFIKFLTSKKESTNLKNIMAFNEKYFDKNKKEIIKYYYKFCESIQYSSPLYCSAKPTCELDNNDKADRSRYFWFILKSSKEDASKNVWFSAVTEEGVLLFIKAKLGFRSCEAGIQVNLLQQTTYYKMGKKIVALYR